MNNTTYEFFIRRAWKCDRFEKGANTDTWESLLYKKHDYEKAIGTVDEEKKRGEYERKFVEIKNYIDAACDNLMYRITSQKYSEELVNGILDLKDKANNANNPNELFTVLNGSFKFLNANNL